MAESYPGWPFIRCEEASQLVVYARWDDVLGLLCQALEDAAPLPRHDSPHS